MSIRKPPRLANWLLERWGPARQNPPLAGDLLEEFRTGRSAAWFWRQTLFVILTGLGRDIRLHWHLFTGVVSGWAAQAGIAFVLWRAHFPPHLPSIFGTIASVLMFIHAARIVWRKFRRKRRADDVPSIAEPAEAEDDEPADLGDLVGWFCFSFTFFLVGYCAFGLLWEQPLWGFIVLQATWLVLLAALALMPESDPGQVKTP